MSRSFLVSGGSVMSASIENPTGENQFASENALKTFMVWARPTITGVGTAFGLGHTAQSAYLAVGCKGENSTVFHETAAGGDSFATGTYVKETWNFLCGTIETGKNARAWLNKGKATSATATRENALNALTIGALELNGSLISHYVGELEHAAGWNKQLTEGQIDELAEGKNPLDVEPEHLIYYWTLEGTSTTTEPSVEGRGPALAVGATAGVGTSHAPVRAPESGLEEKSGSVKIEGGGNPLPTGSKTASAGTTILGGGKVEVAGFENSLDAVVVNGGGTQEVTGTKTTSASAKVEGGGKIELTGRKSGEAAAEVKGGGKLEPSGSKTTSASSEVKGGGKVEVAGFENSLNAVIVNGGGTQELSGTKTGKGLTSVLGGGVVNITGRSDRLGQILIQGGGKILIPRDFTFEPVLDTENGLVIFQPDETGVVAHVIAPERSVVILTESTVSAVKIYDVPQTGAIVQASSDTEAKILTPERSLR